MKRLLTIAACLGVLAIGTVAPVSADENTKGYAETSAPEDQSELIEASKLIDAEAVAERDGVSLDDAYARIADERAIRDIVDTDRLDADTYTGVYFTRENGEFLLHVVTKQGIDTLPLDFPARNELRVVYETAPRSRSELLALRDAIEQLDGQPATEVVPNWATGQIDVVVTSDKDAARIAEQFGDAVTTTIGEPIEAAACTARNNCSPSRGGIFIATPTGNPYPLDWEQCTFGFKTKGINTGIIKLLSAAHCNIDVNPVQYNRVEDGIGNVMCPGGSNTVTYFGTYGDMMKCGDGYFAPGNTVLHDFVNDSQYPITTARTIGNIQNGNYCWMAGSTHYDAKIGTVGGTSSGYLTPWPGHGNTYITGFRCNYQMSPGDSGGPVYFDNGSLGIITATGTGYTVNSYTTPTYLDFALNIKMCLNSGCTN